MPGFDHLAPFLIATLLFAAFPGPALLYTAARTMAGGRRAGLMAALGIHIGCYAHVIAATLGLSAMLAGAPDVFFAIKMAGAAYLCWLGLSMLLSRGDASMPTVRQRSPRRAFMDSIVVELLNPKVALFFVAFLPQFVDPSAAWPVWAQFLALGLFVNLSFSSADVVTVFLTEKVVAAVRRTGAGERIARWAAGSALIGLGVHLAREKAP